MQLFLKMKAKHKVIKFNSEEEWLEARRGKITGTRVKDLIVKRGTGIKKGFYEILAERIALPPSGENPMDRGKRLESLAIERFVQITGKKVNTDLVLWLHGDNDYIAISPDGYIGTTEAVEVKCLSSASHIEAWHTKEIPGEYYDQAMQYFVVNESLKTLYFCFFDPRLPVDFFYVTLNRADIQMEIDMYLEQERKMLTLLKELEDKLTFNI